MSRKLTLKRLSHSDLSLFKRYLDVHPSSKQKGINLNAKVLVGALYQSMPANGKLPVYLSVYGPGPTVQPHMLTRKIIKSPGAKNWRLNGELINDPTSGDPLRYGLLVPGDLVLMEFFDGPNGNPERIRMILVSVAEPADAPIHRVLDALLPPAKAMIVLGQGKLMRTVSGIVPPGHPMQDFLTDEAELELLAAGGEVELDEPEAEPEPVVPAPTPGVAPAPRPPRVYKPKDFNKTARPSLSRVSAETLAKAKVAASENGEAGEELVNAYLENQVAAGSCEWSSRINAAGPYDFKLTGTGTDPDEMIDVKTTVGPFETPFHLSINELKQAVSAPGAYRIYRVYDIKSRPKLRISDDIKEFATKLFPHIQGLPAGVMADGFTLKPQLLEHEFGFGSEIILPIAEE
jgi:hypothetical protein